KSQGVALQDERAAARAGPNAGEGERIRIRSRGVHRVSLIGEGAHGDGTERVGPDIDEAGQQLVVEDALAPVAVLGAGTTLRLHRDLLVGIVDTTGCVEGRDGLWAGEVGIGASLPGRV